MMKISVIVAVYKAEAYLDRCLKSLQNQTFKDFEIILVDDGSPDNSGAICDKWASEDTRFKVIHKSNGGVSTARQAGIDAAQGVYTIHVDPDDWVDNNMLEELYDCAEEKGVDVLICNYLFHWGDNCETSDWTSMLTDDSVDTAHKILTRETSGSLCNKLIKRECYIKYGLHFPVLNYSEDAFICVSLFINNVKTGRLNKAYYHYVHDNNPNSLVKCFNQYKDYLITYYSLLKERDYDLWLDFLRGRFVWYAFDMLVSNDFTETEYKKYLFALEDISFNSMIVSVSRLVRLKMRLAILGVRNYKLARMLGKLLDCTYRLIRGKIIL